MELGVHDKEREREMRGMYQDKGETPVVTMVEAVVSGCGNVTLGISFLGPTVSASDVIQ